MHLSNFQVIIYVNVIIMKPVKVKSRNLNKMSVLVFHLLRTRRKIAFVTEFVCVSLSIPITILDA